jgi:hypothetical protein
MRARGARATRASGAVRPRPCAHLASAIVGLFESSVGTRPVGRTAGEPRLVALTRRPGALVQRSPRTPAAHTWGFRARALPSGNRHSGSPRFARIAAPRWRGSDPPALRALAFLAARGRRSASKTAFSAMRVRSGREGERSRVNLTVTRTRSGFARVSARRGAGVVGWAVQAAQIVGPATLLCAPRPKVGPRMESPARRRSAAEQLLQLPGIAQTALPRAQRHADSRGSLRKGATPAAARHACEHVQAGRAAAPRAARHRPRALEFRNMSRRRSRFRRGGARDSRKSRAHLLNAAPRARGHARASRWDEQRRSRGG